MSSPVHAGFEGLFWVAVVVIVVISEMAKAAKRKGRPPGNPRAGAWGLPPAPDPRSLDARIAERLRQRGLPPSIAGLPRKEMRAQPPPIPPRLAARRAPPAPPRRPSPPPPIKPATASPQRVAAEMAPPALRPAPVPATRSAPAPAPPPRPTAPSPDAQAEALRQALRANLSDGATLRQVVLLAEIIGLPRALRPLNRP